jgi:hypothetical protein
MGFELIAQQKDINKAARESAMGGISPDRARMRALGKTSLGSLQKPCELVHIIIDLNCIYPNIVLLRPLAYLLS